jgi:hypothetical protein
MVVKMVARCTLASLMWLPLSPSFWQEGSVWWQTNCSI